MKNKQDNVVENVYFSPVFTHSHDKALIFSLLQSALTFNKQFFVVSCIHKKINKLSFQER